MKCGTTNAFERLTVLRPDGTCRLQFADGRIVEAEPFADDFFGMLAKHR